MLTKKEPGTLDLVFSLSQEHIRQYREQGFAKIEGVLDRATLEEFKSEFSKKVVELNTLTKPFEERTIYEKAFLQIHNLWTKSEIIKQFVMGKRIAKIAAELMGCKGVRLYHDQALCKEPGGGITPWHADQYYWPLNSNNSITAWIPLQPVPLEMGPLAFATGSFKIKTGRELEIGEESELVLGKKLRDYPIYEAPFKLGEVSFHSGWTFHRAGPNKTDRLREVMTIIYIDKDMRLTEPINKDQKNDREWWCPGVEVGEIINSPLNPIIYSSD